MLIKIFWLHFAVAAAAIVFLYLFFFASFPPSPPSTPFPNPAVKKALCFLPAYYPVYQGSVAICESLQSNQLCIK